MMIDDGDGFFPERVGLFVAKIDVFTTSWTIIKSSKFN